MARQFRLLYNAPRGTTGFRYDGRIWCPSCLSRHVHVPVSHLPDRDMEKPVRSGTCDECGRTLSPSRWEALRERWL